LVLETVTSDEEAGLEIGAAGELLDDLECLQSQFTGG
jgi:hypothetical protein